MVTLAKFDARTTMDVLLPAGLSGSGRQVRVGGHRDTQGIVISPIGGGSMRRETAEMLRRAGSELIGQELRGQVTGTLQGEANGSRLLSAACASAILGAACRRRTTEFLGMMAVIVRPDPAGCGA